MEIIVIAAVVIFGWWLFVKIKRHMAIMAKAMSEGIDFKDLKERCRWWRSWYVTEPNHGKPGTFYRQHLTLLLPDGGISIYETMFPKSSSPMSHEHDKFTLKSEHRFEAGDRIEVREHMFSTCDYNWVRNAQGAGGHWNVSPRHERGAAIIILKNSGHMAKLIELPSVGADILAGNIAVDMRAQLAGIAQAPAAPAVALAPEATPTQAAPRPEGFDL